MQSPPREARYTESGSTPLGHTRNLQELVSRYEESDEYEPQNNAYGRHPAHPQLQLLDNITLMNFRIVQILSENGTRSEAKKLNASNPATTVLPGLPHAHTSVMIVTRCSRAFSREVPQQCETAFTEDIVLVFECGKERYSREVHSVSYSTQSNTLYASYGGNVPNKARGEQFIDICLTGDAFAKTKQFIKPETMYDFKKHFLDGVKYEDSGPEIRGYILYAKGISPFKAIQVADKVVDVYQINLRTSFTTPLSVLQFFDVESPQAIAFDATPDSEWFVFILQKKTTDLSREAERSVILYSYSPRTNMVDPSRYTPPQAGFYPTDVCFWNEYNQGIKLLVTDARNCCVHVVRIENGSCCFERRLAAQKALLSSPTALNVDEDDRVWIGCSDGRIWRCERNHASGDGMDTGDDLLFVENASTFSDDI